jgi:hypothetical protein
MVIDIPYYQDGSRISNSALGWYIKKGPQYLRDMLDGKEEGLSSPQLERGTMIHEYILQPEEFWKDYVILDYEVPTAKQKEFCDMYYKEGLLDPFKTKDELALLCHKEVYKTTTSDIKRIEAGNGMINKFNAYIESLAVPTDKKIISFADLNMLKKIKQNLEEHEGANKLLFDTPTTLDYHNEFHINWTYTKHNVECKSLIDRVGFDHINKKIVLIDLKTTSDVYNFAHSVEQFDYYRQLSFYIAAITWYMLYELNLNIDDYDLEVYIIAIQTNGSNEVRVFNMLDEQQLLAKKQLIEDTLAKIRWHQETGKWEHTKEYYDSDGIENLS